MTIAVPSEETSVISIALCLSCKTVVKPEVTNFLMVIFKGHVWYGYHRALPLDYVFLCKRKYPDYFNKKTTKDRAKSPWSFLSKY